MNHNRLSLPGNLLIAALCLSSLPSMATGPAQSPHQHASTPVAPASPIAVPLDAATRAALPRIRVTATTGGETLDCEGTSLVSLLRAAAVLSEQPPANDALASYVLVSARDGSRVVYALAELEPTLGASQATLVDHCDGKPLDEKDGPLRLIAADESRPVRWLRQVQSITVVMAP